MGLSIWHQQQLGGLDVAIFDGLTGDHYEGLHAILAVTRGAATLAGTVVPLDARLQHFLAPDTFFLYH